MLLLEGSAGEREEHKPKQKNQKKKTKKKKKNQPKKIQTPKKSQKTDVLIQSFGGVITARYFVCVYEGGISIVVPWAIGQ